MNEYRTIRITTAAVVLLWTTVVVSAITASVVMALGHPDLAVMLGMWAIVFATGAAVLMAREYAARICALIRSLNGVERPPDHIERSRQGEVHPLR